MVTKEELQNIANQMATKEELQNLGNQVATMANQLDKLTLALKVFIADHINNKKS